MNVVFIVGNGTWVSPVIQALATTGRQICRRCEFDDAVVSAKGADGAFDLGCGYAVNSGRIPIQMSALVMPRASARALVMLISVFGEPL
jgi:hypothetical protein